MCLQIKTKSTDMRSRVSLQVQLQTETKSLDMRSRVSLQVKLQKETKSMESRSPSATKDGNQKYGHAQ